MSDTNPTLPIISRKEALAQGLKRYFTGTPCIRGHIAERTASSSVCLLCGRDKYARNPEYYRARARAWTKANPERHCAKVKRLRNANLEHYRARARARRKGNLEHYHVQAKAWREANPEPSRARSKAWREADPERARAQVRTWRKANLERVRAAKRVWTGQRRAQKRNPIWVDKKALRKVMLGCPPNMVVDHIVPLKGKTIEGCAISGLHVPWNLQYLTPEDNMRKGSRMRPEDQALCEQA